jgi:hypothetical protein
VLDKDNTADEILDIFIMVRVGAQKGRKVCTRKGFTAVTLISLPPFVLIVRRDLKMNPVIRLSNQL